MSGVPLPRAQGHGGGQPASGHGPPSQSSRLQTLEQHIELLAPRQPGLAAGLRELGAGQLDAMSPVHPPTVDARKLADFAASAARQCTGDALVVLGLGTPAMVAAVRAVLAPERALIFIEPTLDLALRLLSQQDYRGALEDEYTAVVIGGDDRSLQRQLESLVFGWGIAEVQLIVNPMRPLGGEIAEMVGNMLRGALRGVELSTATGAKYGETAIANIMANLPAAVSGRDIGAIGRVSTGAAAQSEVDGDESGVGAESAVVATDAAPPKSPYAGLPAFIIGAGPGLNEVLPILAERDADGVAAARARGLVIACDTALPPLMEAGLAPDIVVTLDIADTKAAVFERCYVKDALLVALLAAHPVLVRAWIGPKAFAVDSHPFARWAAPHITPPAEFGNLGNVAHLGYALARGLGCDPVILCGVDYAFARDGSVYAEGVVHDAPRTRETMPEEQRSSLVEVAGNDGESVTTMRNMAVYAETLSDMALAGGRTVTLSAAGMRMEGITHTPVDETLAALPTQSVLRPVSATAPDSEAILVQRAAVRRAAVALEQNLRTYAAAASQFADEADRQGAALGSGNVDEEKLVRVLQPHLEAFTRHAGMNELIEPLQPAVTYEINRLQRLTRGMTDPLVRARTRLLAIAGPAAGGAALAEHAAERVREMRSRLG